MAAMKRRRLGDESGAELIELMIALPILILTAAAIMDFGVLFMRYEVVTNAAREGARIAILPAYGEADVQARVAAYLAAGGLTETPTTTVTNSTVETTAGGPTVNVVTVRVSYTHDYIFLGPMAALVGGGPYASTVLRAASMMRREAPAAGS
jgi:Flp pilus assembly protein TadG